MKINEDKINKLRAIIEGYCEKDVMIAFSGGVDSSLLLKLCVNVSHKTGKKVYAVLFNTSLHPMEDLPIARKVARETGADFQVINVDELKDAGILNNPENRCYLCKKHLFTSLMERGRELGVTTFMEGTNQDDLSVYRPGIQAIRELGINSPLMEAGLTKAEVRELAESLGISVASRPSAPCLATRFPYGTRLSREVMDMVEKGETWLKEQGFVNVRIRVHGTIARIEVDRKDLIKAVESSERITEKLKDTGFQYITLDLEGFRSGSMDINIKK